MASHNSGSQAKKAKSRYPDGHLALTSSSAHAIKKTGTKRLSGADRRLKRKLVQASAKASARDLLLDDEVRHLEASLFGDVDNVGEIERDISAQQPPDTAAAAAGPAWFDPEDASIQVDIATGPSRRRKLRHEEDEQAIDGAEYQRRLRVQHAKLTGRSEVPSWAQVEDTETAAPKTTKAARADDDGSKEAVDIAGLLQSGRSVVRTSAKAADTTTTAAAAQLPRGTLAISRLIDANLDDIGNCPADVVAFHPKRDVPLLLVAGLDKVARIFRVSYAQGGEGCMAKLGIPETPIRSAAWNPAGTHVVASGRRPRVHIWDVSHGACTAVTPPRVDVGDSGHAPSCEHFVVNEDESMPLLALPRSHGAVQLLSLRGHQQAGVLRTGAGTVRALCFGGGRRSTELLTASRDGSVNVWDVRMNRCVASVNVGQGTSVGCVSSSANGSHFAASLSGGYVHVYRWPSESADDASREAVHRFGNLTTDVDGLDFSRDGSLLCFRSRLARDALRVAHLASGTVYSNWPSSKTPLHFVHSSSFSAGSGALAIGNARGRVLLYRLSAFARL